MNPGRQEHPQSTPTNWETERKDLPPVLDLYRRLLIIQSRARQKIPAPSALPGEQAIRERLDSGRPALQFTDVQTEHPILFQLCEEVAAICQEYSQYLGWEEDHLADRLVDKQLAETWFDGIESPRGPALSLLERICFQAVYRPFLQACSTQLLQFIDRERWYGEYCPVCAGSPDFAFLDKERGARHLVCSCCDTEWPFLRLRCPYCGNQSTESLAYYSTAGESHRLDVCEKCRTYIKTIDLRRAGKEIDFAFERLASCDLDYQGYEKGYHLPPVRVVRLPGAKSGIAWPGRT